MFVRGGTEAWVRTEGSGIALTTGWGGCEPQIAAGESHCEFYLRCLFSMPCPVPRLNSHAQTRYC